MTMIHHIPEPPKPNDDWSAAYLVQDRQVTNLLAAPIERLIEQRGGWHLLHRDRLNYPCSIPKSVSRIKPASSHIA